MGSMNNPLTRLWLELPEEIKAQLRLGFTGKHHLLNMLDLCLRQGDQNLHPLIIDIAQTLFAENPLSGEVAQTLTNTPALCALLPEATLAPLQWISAQWRLPSDPTRFGEIMATRDFPRIRQYVEEQTHAEPDNLFWYEHTFSLSLMDKDPHWAKAMLGTDCIQAIPAIAVNLAARIAKSEGNDHDAARLSQNTEAVFGASVPRLRTGNSLLKAGDRESGKLLLAESLSHAPWNTSLILNLHDILTGRDHETTAPAGTTAILLYSWNKAIELDATLHSLHESEIPNSSIYVLDNGSTDQTNEIFHSWQTRFDTKYGTGHFSIITLPVNIGAPAARNWLMHHPGVADHDFICYLDDDVVLPQDWLLRLGSAMHHYPDAGVWGCKVVDHVNPAMIQSADNHLLVDPTQTPNLSTPSPNPFRLSNLHVQTLDEGLFDIMRPCASVTGCCHIFRSDILLSSGDFALHLSPTQYDDMEHDLRLCTSGRFPVYQGHLSILHKKRSGSASRVSMQEEGNALGNKYKMQTMHNRASLLEASTKEQEALDDDLLQKMALVGQILKN